MSGSHSICRAHLLIEPEDWVVAVAVSVAALRSARAIRALAPATSQYQDEPCLRLLRLVHHSCKDRGHA
jgi:hypothetical protein